MIIYTPNGERIADEYISVDQDACINVQVESEGKGTVIGDGEFAKGDEIMLTAMPEDNYKFIGWYNDKELLSNNIVYNFNAIQDIKLIAKFIEFPDENTEMSTEATTTTVTETSTQPTTTEITTEKPSITTTQASVITTEAKTETTTKETVTETTTSKPNYSSPSGGGGGGGGGSYKKAVTTTESTTESVTTEKSTEATTEEKVIHNYVRVSIGSNIIDVGNKKYTIDAAPYIQPESNSTLVPLRFAAIAISGGDVEKADSSSIIDWDAVTKTATITVKGNVIKFTSGSVLMYKNNSPMVMENGVKAEIKSGRMFIPFRALGTALSVKVDWDAETKTAIYKA